MLQLPVELKLMIVRQLTRDDLFNLLTVCKDLKAFVHPLFYEHMLFTSAGFTFPHAPNPYPFLDIPGLKLEAPTSAEERESIMNRIRSVTVASHRHDVCAGWQKLQKQPLSAKADLLTIELAFPSQDGIAECHEPVRFDDCDMCDADSDHQYCHPEDGGHPFPRCTFLEGLEDTTAKKIVIKNYPLLSNGVRNTFLPKPVESASELVVLLEPHNCMDPFYRDDDDDYNDGCDHDCPYGRHSLMDIIPSNVTDVTLVFDTRSPNHEWAPSCKHYDSEWYDGGCSCCPCGCDSYDCDPCRDENPPKQQSCWQSPVLKSLTRGIAASTARVTIVNYSSIIPDGAERNKALSALKGGKRFTLRNRIQRELRVAHQSQEEYETRLADVHFVSMLSWIRSGAWEDVFKREELKAWFNHIAKKKKAKEAAAGKSEPATPAVPKEGKPADKPAQAEPAR